MDKLISRKSIALTICYVTIFSLAFGLITLSPHSESSNEFQFSELFDVPFQQLPGTFLSYEDSGGYVDLVLASSDFNLESGNVLGLIKNHEASIILIESRGNITEIIADEEGNIQKINTLKLKLVDSKEFYWNEELTERIVIELYELDIPSLNSSDSDIASVLKLSHEVWENKPFCISDKNNYMYIEGLFFVDISDDIVVAGTSSEVLANSILLSVDESDDETQNQNVFATYSNSAKWKSKGLFITSKSTRDTQISFDRNLNIGTWMTQDSWIGMGP